MKTKTHPAAAVIPAAQLNWIKQPILYVRQKVSLFLKFITMGKFHRWKEDSFKSIKLMLAVFGKIQFILVYQIGKTGSQTVEATVLKMGYKFLVYRTHYISEASTKQALLPKKVNSSVGSAMVFQNQYAKKVRNAMDYWIKLNGLKSNFPKMQIIVGIREPVGLMLAAIFQNYSMHFSSIEQITVQACRDLIFKFDNTILLNWFKNEFDRVIKINIFENAFPTDLGYAVYENEFARVLLYRFENISALQGILESFLQTKVPAISKENIGSNKPYASIYAAVKKNIELPESYLHTLYNTKIMQHFYTESEREGMIRYWASAATREEKTV